MRRLMISIAVVVMTSAVFGAELPTPGQAEADFNSSNYRGALEKISSILTDPRTKVNPDTRYSLLMLRGECMLRMRRQDLAIDAFNAAALVVKDDAVLDRRALAQASAIITKASTSLKYVPTQKAATVAIDILTKDGRKEAALALFDDQYRLNSPQIDEAIQGKSLAVLESLVPAISDMYWLEVVGTGTAIRSLEMGKSMGARARELIQPDLDQTTARVLELAQLAKEPVAAPTGSEDAFTYRGLRPTETDELRDLSKKLIRIQLLSQQARKMGLQLGGTPEAWNEILADCGEARQKARMATVTPRVPGGAAAKVADDSQ